MKLSGLVAILVILIQFGCQKDDTIEGPPPAGENVPAEIITSPGSQIAFSGTFTDENGFSSISLVNEELLLDKQIVFANQVKKYYLDYKFTIPETAASTIYDVAITATNLGGQTQGFSSKVDVASNPESSNMVSSISAAPGEEIAFTGTITDKQGISTISISSGSLNIDETIEPAGNPMEYELNYIFTVPVDAEKKVQ